MNTIRILGCDAKVATEQIISEPALMTIIEHVEKHIGDIEQGWKDKKSSLALQIVSFKDSPAESITTYHSLGMSNSVLVLNKGKKVRQELVTSFYSISISGMIVSLLMSLCEAILDRGNAVLRGEVIPLSMDLAERIGFSAVYCTNPIFFDDDFCTYDETAPPTVIVWIVPIYESESAYIEINGWEKFEDLMEEIDPDLCSMEREPVI